MRRVNSSVETKVFRPPPGKGASDKSKHGMSALLGKGDYEATFRATVISAWKVASIPNSENVFEGIPELGATPAELKEGS
jgi:hypothetical protein